MGDVCVILYKAAGWRSPIGFAGCQFTFWRVPIYIWEAEIVGAEKTMTATGVTGFDAIFSTGFFATFSRFSGARLTKLHREPGEKAKKSSGEPPVETAPRNCRFLSLVVVERVLKLSWGCFVEKGNQKGGTLGSRNLWLKGWCWTAAFALYKHKDMGNVLAAVFTNAAILQGQVPLLTSMRIPKPLPSP